MPSGSRTPTATLFFRIDLIYHGPGRRATPRVCIPPTTAFPAHLTISWALVRDAFRACPLSLPRLPHPLCELRTRTRLDSGQQLNDPTPGLPSLRLSRAPPSRATILLLPKAPDPAACNGGSLARARLLGGLTVPALGVLLLVLAPSVCLTLVLTLAHRPSPPRESERDPGPTGPPGQRAAQPPHEEDFQDSHGEEAPGLGV